MTNPTPEPALPTGLEPPRPLREFWGYFSDNRGALTGLFIVVFVLLLAAFAPLIVGKSRFLAQQLEEVHGRAASVDGDAVHGAPGEAGARGPHAGTGQQDVAAPVWNLEQLRRVAATAAEHTLADQLT